MATQVSDRKQKFEQRWANLFLKLFNSIYKFDYRADVPFNRVSILDVDVIAKSRSNTYPEILLQLVAARDGMEGPPGIRNYITGPEPIIEAVQEKYKKYSNQDPTLKAIKDLVLIICGRLSFGEAQEEIMRYSFREIKALPFGGIYYVGPRQLSGSPVPGSKQYWEPSFIVPIKHFRSSHPEAKKKRA